MSDIKISLFKPAGRKFFQAEWTDPKTGKTRRKSTGTPIKRDADRFCGRLAKEIEAGEKPFTARVTWKEFRQRYMNEHVKPLSESAFRVASRYTRRCYAWVTTRSCATSALRT